MRHRSLVVAIVVAAAGCNGAEVPSRGGSQCTPTSHVLATVSCTFPDIRLCNEVIPAGLMTNCELATLQSTCSSQGGGIGGYGCPTTGIVPGRCHYADASVITGVPVAAGASLDEVYFTPEWSTSTAQEFCARAPAGVWEP